MDRTLLAVIIIGVIMAGVLPLAIFLVFLPAPVTGDLALEPIAEGLSFPVSVVQSPDGRIFYNELQDGRVRIIRGGELLSEAFVSLDVVSVGETGLLGLALDPEFPVHNFVYVYYTYTSSEGMFNRISRFRDLGNVAGPEQILLDRIPASEIHNSGRLRFGPDDKLHASAGDARVPVNAQNPASVSGKILRMNPDGSLPSDNPISGSYAYLLGIRNVFGMDFTPDGLLLFTENGPVGNDEVNVGRAGLNYGWPVVEGVAHDPRFEDPVAFFTPSIAPTGLAYYTGNLLGSERRNSAFFGSWIEGTLRRLVGDPTAGDAVGVEVELRADGGILDVTSGNDGRLYVTTPSGIYAVILVPSEGEPVGPGPWRLLPSADPFEYSLLGNINRARGFGFKV